MARLTPLWMQSGEYPAATDRQLIGAIWPNGGAAGLGVSVVAGSRNVNIAAGRAVVPQADGSAYLCVATSGETVSIPAASPAGTNRYDQIVVRVRDGDPNNDFIFDVVQGSGSASPPLPAVPAGTFRIGLVYVEGGAAFLTAGNVSGPWVTGESALRPQTPVMLRSNIGPAAAVNAGSGNTVILGTGTGGLANIRTVAGRRYRITASARGFQSGGVTGMAAFNLFRDGGDIGIIGAHPTLGNNQWMGATGMYVENGDNNEHFWQIMGSSNPGTLQCPANRAFITVEDIGPPV